MDLLGRARSLIKGLGTPPVAKIQYYSVVCPLGHRLRGQRTGGYQALRCPSCGEGIFVLPASPLPEPVAPERSARSRPANIPAAEVDEGPIELKDPSQVTVDIVEPEDPEVESEIVWDDEAAGEPSRGTDAGDRDDGGQPGRGQTRSAGRRDHQPPPAARAAGPSSGRFGSAGVDP